MTLGQKKLAVARFARWPEPDRQFVNSLPLREAQLVAEAVVELDISPVPAGWQPSPHGITIVVGT
jgi:hypothetical protein